MFRLRVCSLAVFLGAVLVSSRASAQFPTDPIVYEYSYFDAAPGSWLRVSLTVVPSGLPAELDPSCGSWDVGVLAGQYCAYFKRVTASYGGYPWWDPNVDFMYLIHSWAISGTNDLPFYGPFVADGWNGFTLAMDLGQGSYMRALVPGLGQGGIAFRMPVGPPEPPVGGRITDLGLFNTSYPAEPATLLLLGTGLVGIGAARLRHRRKGRGAEG